MESAMLSTLAQVALGGAIGATCRFLTVQGALRLFGPGFPVGTMLVNVAGSFAMGVLFVVLAERDALRFSPFLMTGILGGFTTFSAYSLDAFRLYEDGAYGAAAFYVVGSVVLSLVGLALGIAAARSTLA
jgi:fluoride exporter